MIQDGLVSRHLSGTRATEVTGASTASSNIPSQAAKALCTVALPSGGILRFNESFSFTLEDSITFESRCDDHAVHGCSNSGNSTVVKFDDPFYASVAPQLYALSTATIISYILVILIFITPRTFYVGGPGGGASFLGLRSLVPGAGSSSVIGVGRRPLLQKIAAITVAVSLTIASADTFRVAEKQYNDGLMDSQHLVDEVIGSIEIRVVRVVSDTFLWLAQVQTLIRLFPRHKEKVTIKWLGFALVTCDAVFSILENFVSNSTLTRPKNFSDAIPALSYLFQMAISLIYASCVVYYCLSKRRFAFWHPKMKNIILVAGISLSSVLIPVVFFVLDVSQPSIATWGEYIRWVGAAAASVVVWEWVERIEALERDERKDGILGREIFDGDEMVNMGGDSKSNSSTYFGFGKRSSTDGEKRVSMLPIPDAHLRNPFRRKRKTQDGSKEEKVERRKSFKFGGVAKTDAGRPPETSTPISRSDTASAASTVYAVRYHNVSSPSPVMPEEAIEMGRRSRQPSVPMNGHMAPLEEAESVTLASRPNQEPQPDQAPDDRRERDDARSRQVWQAVANPFKRKCAEPPAEVAAQLSASNVRRSPAQTYHNLRDRFNAFKAGQRHPNSGKGRDGPSPPGITVIPAQPRPARLVVPGETPEPSRHPSMISSEANQKSSSSRSRESLPVTVIPAPVRGARTWSPDDLKDNDRSPPQNQLTLDDQDDTQRITVGPTHPSGEVFTARGALIIAESPQRVKNHDDGNIGSPSTHRTSKRLRAPTIDSLDDRLSSTSPASASGSQRRQRRESPTTSPRAQSHGQSRPDEAEEGFKDPDPPL